MCDACKTQEDISGFFALLHSVVYILVRELRAENSHWE